MKKLNRKGFTLIELLAVIIILGVLMIIAIPSVTTYIQNSRKSAWVDTAVAYAKAVVNKVNEGGKLQFFTENTLYMVPVGHISKQSCVSVESGGQSPFSNTWAYAYVGVVYNGTGYDYYFIGEDGAGQGIYFVTQAYLNEKGTDAMYTVKRSSAGNDLADLLTKEYELEADASLGEGKTVPKYTYYCSGQVGVCKKIENANDRNEAYYATLSQDEVTTGETKEAGLKLSGSYSTPGKDKAPSYNAIVFIHAKEGNTCEYQPTN